MLILKDRTMHLLNIAYTAHKNDSTLSLMGNSRFFDEAYELVGYGFICECDAKEIGWVTDMAQYVITDAGINYVERKE